MSGTKIKLCGLFRPEDIDYANRVRPDYIGFVFWEKSRRRVTPEQAAQLRRRLEPGICAAGVFVDAPCGEVIALLKEGVIDMAQLHGEETEGTLRHIQAVTGKPVMKAVKVKSRSDIDAWLDSAADLLLFDSGMGSGRAFDWRLLEGVERAFFLAGGLHAGNLREALEELHPWGVDLSSGVETDGKKDFEKMRGAVDIVRSFR